MAGEAARKAKKRTNATHAKQHHDGAEKEVSAVVNKVLNYHNERHEINKQKELDGRQMVQSRHQLSVRILHHDASGGMHSFNVQVEANTSFQLLKQVVMAECKLGSKLHLSWVDNDGEVVELNMKTFHSFVHQMWCTLPWVVHVREGDSQEDVQQTHIGRTIFARYDINRHGRLDRNEFGRMFRDLRLERFECSPLLVERYIDHEWQRLVSDSSGMLDLNKFTRYVSRMGPWVRAELMSICNEVEIFQQLAGRAVESYFRPTRVPHAWEMVDFGDGRGLVAIMETGCFGIRLEVPLDALPDGQANRLNKISVRTLFRGSVTYLAEAAERNSLSNQARSEESTNPLYNLPCSPIVRVDYPAFTHDNEMPELGVTTASHFLKPLTLIMPHNFDTRDDQEAIATLAGAPHGATSWEPIAKQRSLHIDPLEVKIRLFTGARDPQNPVKLHMSLFRGQLMEFEDGIQMHKNGEGSINGTESSVSRDGLLTRLSCSILARLQPEMRVNIPYAGIFCAFPSKDAWAVVAAARFLIFTMSELPRYKPTGLRVQICPEIPPQQQEMEFSESSTWGTAACTGASHLLYLVKGVRFRLRYLDQERELTWMGMRASVDFTVPPAGIGGRAPADDDPDRRDFIDGVVTIDLLEGIGARASNVRACAKVMVLLLSSSTCSSPLISGLDSRSNSELVCQRRECGCHSLLV